jgi:hypothetical protein
MSDLRPAGEPGGYLPSMSHTCGDNDAEACGHPATVHIFAGTPEDGPGDWATFSCDKHAHHAQRLAFDWHPVASVCGTPDTVWQSRNLQGQGFCYWPAAEQAHNEQFQKIGVTT